MTLAADLARIICTGVIPEPGVIHDPTQPLVLGNQDGNDYVVITWDPLAHRCQIQSVYKPPTGPTQQATLTFDSLGSLLVNNQSLAVAVPELAVALAAAQAAAAQSVAAASAAAASQTSAATSASTAGSSATAAIDAAQLSQDFATAPTGTPLPGGGDSSAVSAQRANSIAAESRDLDVSIPISANETFESGFLFTERQVASGSNIEVTVPPGIFSSSELISRWAAYRLRGTGSVKFVPQAGGTNLVTPQVKGRGRFLTRWNANNSTIRKTLALTAAVPAIVAGEFIAVFHASHQGPASAINMVFTTPGTTGLTFSTLIALPANARAVDIPDFFVVRAPLTAFAAGNINLSFDEGVNVHIQCCDWWALEGTAGLTPLFAQDIRTTAQVTNRSTILAVPAQSLLLATAASVGPIGSVGFSTMSSNLSVKQSGDTTGAVETIVSNTDGHKNEAFAVGEGVAIATGDTEVTSTWTSAAFKGNILGVAYQPKSVIGGGTVVMNFEADRDTLNVKNGLAELWFRNDGITVDVRTSKP